MCVFLTRIELTNFKLSRRRERSEPGAEAEGSPRGELILQAQRGKICGGMHKFRGLSVGKQLKRYKPSQAVLNHANLTHGKGITFARHHIEFFQR